MNERVSEFMNGIENKTNWKVISIAENILLPSLSEKSISPSVHISDDDGSKT